MNTRLYNGNQRYNMPKFLTTEKVFAATARTEKNSLSEPIRLSEDAQLPFGVNKNDIRPHQLILLNTSIIGLDH